MLQRAAVVIQRRRHMNPALQRHRSVYIGLIFHRLNVKAEGAIGIDGEIIGVATRTVVTPKQDHAKLIGEEHVEPGFDGQGMDKSETHRVRDVGAGPLTVEQKGITHANTARIIADGAVTAI